MMRVDTTRDTRAALVASAAASAAFLVSCDAKATDTVVVSNEASIRIKEFRATMIRELKELRQEETMAHAERRRALAEKAYAATNAAYDAFALERRDATIVAKAAADVLPANALGLIFRGFVRDVCPITAAEYRNAAGFVVRSESANLKHRAIVSIGRTVRAEFSVLAYNSSRPSDTGRMYTALDHWRNHPEIFLLFAGTKPVRAMVEMRVGGGKNRKHKRRTLSDLRDPQDAAWLRKCVSKFLDLAAKL